MRNFTLKPIIGSRIDWQHPLSYGLTGCWLINENGGNFIKSLSGQDNGIGSSLNWESTKRGLLPDFNSTFATKITLPLFSKMLLPGKMTIATEVYPRSSGGSSFGRICDRTGGATSTFALRGATPNGWSLQVGPIRNASANSAVFNTWQSVVATWDGGGIGTGIHIYKDGKELTYNSTLDGAAYDSSANIPAIGYRTVDNSRYFDGFINYVYVYNRVLSVREIQSLYLSPYQFFIQSKNRIHPYIISTPTTSNLGIMTLNTGYWGAL